MPTIDPVWRFMIGIIVTAALGLHMPPASAQGTSEQRSACDADAKRFCAYALGDHFNPFTVSSCLRSHERDLSKRCHDVFFHH